MYCITLYYFTLYFLILYALTVYSLTLMCLDERLALAGYRVGSIMYFITNVLYDPQYTLTLIFR